MRTTLRPATFKSVNDDRLTLLSDRVSLTSAQSIDLLDRVGLGACAKIVR